MKRKDADKDPRAQSVALSLYDADLKSAGLERLTRRFNMLRGFLGNEYKLITQQEERLARMRENAESGGPVAAFRSLAHEVDLLQIACERECGMR